MENTRTTFITSLSNSSTAAPKSSALANLINPQIFLNCANAFSGKLFFSLPLITFQHTDGSTTLVNLTYNPLQTSDVQLDMGLGWGIGKNDIQYNSNQQQYTITIQGSQFLMQRQTAPNNIKTIPFSVLGSELVILLDPAANNFRVFKVGGYTQTYSYSPALKNTWQLTNDARPDGSSLTYAYNYIQNEAYLSNVTHSDGQQLLKLAYNTNAVFKLASVEIDAHNTPSATFTSNLVNRILSFQESGANVFSTYSYHPTETLIESISLAILKIGFSYQQQTLSAAASNNALSYSMIGQQPNLFYGPNYFIGASLSNFGLIIEKCDSQSFKVEVSSNIGYAKRYPSLSLGLEPILSYMILPQQENIIVYLAGSSGGKIFLFNAAASTDDTVFQVPIHQWDVTTTPALINSCPGGFYLVGLSSCLVFLPKTTSWESYSLVSDVVCLSITSDGEDVFIYTDTSLRQVKDLTQPYQQGTAISGAVTGWLSSMKQWIRMLAPLDGQLQQQLQLQFSESQLQKNGNYLLLSAVVAPKDMVTPFRTTLQGFQDNSGTFQALQPVDNPNLLTHLNLIDLSTQVFPEDVVTDQYIFRRQIYFSGSDQTFKLRIRNITILSPGQYSNQTIEQVMTTGITYTLKQTIQMKNVYSGQAQRNDSVNFKIQTSGSAYTLSYFNPSLKSDLNKGLYTFQSPSDSGGNMIFFQPTKIDEDQIIMQITQGSDSSQQVTATGSNDYKSFYNYIVNQYSGTNALSADDFASLVETDQDLPNEVVFALTDILMGYLANIDNTGRISCQGWQMATITSTPVQITQLPLSNDFYLAKDNGLVCLYKNDGSKLFQTSVHALEDVVNFFPSCLAWEKDGLIELLGFSGEPPKPDAQATPFRAGTIVPSASYPFNPFFTLAIQDPTNEQDKSEISIYQVQKLISDAVQQDWVVNSQMLQCGDLQETTQFGYKNPWQFGLNKMFYRSVTKIPLVNSQPQGSTVNTLAGNLVQQTIYDQTGLQLESSQNQETDSNSDEEESQLVTLTSTLQSQSGGFTIAEIEGAFFEGQEADFMSFQSYEMARINPQVASLPLWQMEKGAVIQGWSLSGGQYLELAQGGSLQITYTPDEYNKIFCVGIWVCSTADLSTQSPLSMQFTSQQKNQVSATGVIKNQIGKWSYIEAILQLTDLPSGLESGTLLVTISASQATLAIDNYRLCPMGCAMKARVFDPILRVPIGIFDSLGHYQKLVYTNQQLIACISAQSVKGLFYKFNPHLDYPVAGSLRPSLYGTDLSVKPNNSFFEDGDPNSIESRWKIDLSQWQLTQNVISHSSSNTDFLAAILAANWTTENLGCYIECNNLTSTTSLTLNFENYTIPISPMKWSTDQQSVTLLAIRLGSRIQLFANGQLVIDEIQTSPIGSATLPFSLVVTGNIALKNIMLFDQPKLTLRYKNFKGQSLQKLVAVNENQALLTLNNYDALGRNQQSSLPLSIGADAEGHLLTYRVNTAVFPSRNFQYEPSPLSNVSQIQLAQTDYAAHPSNITRGTFNSLQKTLPHLMKDLQPWLNDHFLTDNYIYVVSQDSDGIYSITIQDGNNQPQATFQQTNIGFIQNQFAYQAGKLISQKLPRNFVLQLGTKPTVDQAVFIRTFNYTEDGQLHKSSDPDYGTDLLVHDPQSAALRFQVHYSLDGQFSYLLFYDYDTEGCINYIGHHSNPTIQRDGQQVNLNDRTTLETALKSMSSIAQVPNSTQQLMDDTDQLYLSEVAQYSSDLAERRQLQSIYTEQFLNVDAPIIGVGGSQEFFKHDLSGNIITKQCCVANQCDQVTYAYTPQGLLASVTYPTDVSAGSSELIYGYDNLKRVIAIYSADNKTVWAKFTYVGATNQLATETLPVSNLVRTYSYNSANQLTGISDSMLVEQLTYTTKAFQENQTYTQLISFVAFSSPWVKSIPQSDITALTQLSNKLNALYPNQTSTVQTFVQALQVVGYLDSRGFVNKVFNLQSTYDLTDSIFVLSDIAPLLDQQPTLNPINYSYAYEFANQLTKAKFTQEQINNPLRFSATAISQYSSGPNVFPFNPKIAQDIYNALEGYVTSDGIWNLSLAEALLDTLMPRPSSDSAAGFLKKHPNSLANLLLEFYLQRMPLCLPTFGGFYLVWVNNKNLNEANTVLDEAKAAWNWLYTNKFIDAKGMVTASIISQDLQNLAQTHKIQNQLLDLVGLIHFYQMYAIGQSTNDVWVYGQDVHGNMSKFYVGDTRYSVSFSSSSNQIDYVTIDSPHAAPPHYAFKHDSNGNVNQAPHLKINSILYDPYLSRPSWITMSNGTNIQFSYDSKGERSLKRVEDSKGNWKEVRYLRNQQGQPISEWHSDNQGSSSELSYIYGPHGLVGFSRNGQQFSVLKDHEGSIRVIVDAQQKVVYATHYLPYGQKTQEYGDPTLISYGYIGQEFDGETGLYNFNARLYDPQLGRFYQVDPQKQYSSPYIYAGNSPISNSDPSGLFSWSDFFGGFLSAMEIVGGVALDVLSGGTLAEVGGILIGAGTSGLIYSIQNSDNFSWSQFGEEEGIGAAIGAVTAGFGSIEGKVVEKVVADISENSFKKIAAEGATRMVIRSATGVVTSVGQTILENVAHGQSWDQGLENAVWIGALTGATTAGIGVASESLGRSAGFVTDDSTSSVFNRGLKSMLAGTVSGFVGDATGTLIVNAITGQPLDSGLWQSAIGNVVGGVTAAGHTINPDRPPIISRGLQYKEIAAGTNCLAQATFNSMQKQGILGNITKPEDLRRAAANSMKSADPSTLRNQFKESLANFINSDDRNGLTPELQQLVFDVRVKLNDSETSSQSVSALDLLNRLDDKEMDGYISKYIDAIASGDVWGNFLELNYLGQTLNLKFRVDIKGKKWSSIGPDNALNTLFFHYTGDHYDVYHKQGIAFFTPKRRYVPLDEEHGFGAGVVARAKIEKSKGNTKFLAQLEKINKKNYIMNKTAYSSMVFKLKSGAPVTYTTAAGKLSTKAYGPLEFARDLKANDTLHLAANDTIIGELVNQGGSYANLNYRCSFALLVESNHMPPFAVVNKLFKYKRAEISCVSMYQQDHRFFPSTGRLGGGKLTKGEISAVDEAIKAAGFPIPSSDVTTCKDYHGYLGTLFDDDLQQSYAKMLEIEIRIKYLLFGGRYETGCRQAVKYAQKMEFITSAQADKLIKL